VTVTMLGVVPLVGDTESQLIDPLVVVTAVVTLYVNGCPLLEIEIVCMAAGPPAVCCRLSAMGLGVTVPEVMVSVTGIVMGLSATPEVLAVMVMLPVYVPGERSPGTTNTVMLFWPAAVEPLAGLTNSQTPPVVVVEVCVHATWSVELVLVSVMTCAGGEPAPTGAVKLSALTLETICAERLTYRVTGMVRGLFGTAAPVAGLVAVIVMVPVQVVPPPMEPGCTVTGRVASVVPLGAGFPMPPGSNHAPPQVVTVCAAVKFSGAPVLLVSFRFCEAVAAWPTWLENVIGQD
jgi:hypothetical protein